MKIQIKSLFVLTFLALTISQVGCSGSRFCTDRGGLFGSGLFTGNGMRNMFCGDNCDSCNTHAGQVYSSGCDTCGTANGVAPLYGGVEAQLQAPALGTVDDSTMGLGGGVEPPN